MSAIAPSSVQMGGDEGGAQTAKVPVMALDRLAECGRMAVKFGLINFAEGGNSVVSRANQASLRA